MTKHYTVNEMFYSLQGEGARAGTANVFIRFAGCNLTCKRDGEAGFDCDTEFSSGTKMTAKEIANAVKKMWPQGDTIPSVILTGGEPLLQVDDELMSALGEIKVAIETNGTRPLPTGAIGAWVSCSPKTAEHTLQIGHASELRYVRHEGQALPKPSTLCANLFLSPAFSDDPAQTARNLKWCMKLVKENPEWRLSVQMHKLWGVR